MKNLRQLDRTSALRNRLPRINQLIPSIFCFGALLSSLPAFAAAQRQLPATAPADSTVCTACQNFYQFANKRWLDSTSIPPASSKWGVWEENEARVLDQLRTILQTAANRGGRPSLQSQRLLGSFYSSCMDSVGVAADGFPALRPTLTAVASIVTGADLARELGYLHRAGIPAVFVFSSDVDRIGDLHYVASIEQGRVGLSPGDYTSLDSASARRRAAYGEHVARVFVLAGDAPANARRESDRVLGLESALAAARMTRIQQVNSTLQQYYGTYPFAKLESLTPGFSWDAYLKVRRAQRIRSVTLPQPEYLTAVARLITTKPIADWRAYLRWSVLADASPFLSSEFAEESFRYSQLSSGVKTQAPRWQRCVREAGADLPELLGHAYIAQTFSQSSKDRIATMVHQIREVLMERIANVPWLTASTRQQALRKAAAFRVKIAYPDKWHDYSTLRIRPGSFVSKRMEARQFESDRLVMRIGRSPDQGEWDFHGQYYFVPQSPTAWANWDEILFPAAYLQSPLYDSTADLATNYGGIGVVIAHEMTHLFTADGADIDAAGRIRHWWTAEDSTRFSVIQDRLVKQYSGYTVLDSATHVNGLLTLGENLADVGGVQLAYAALERALAGQNHRGPAPQDDTTPERRFFLAYARSRVSKSRPQNLRQQVAYDGHAPSWVRVNGPLSNSSAFARLFGCKPGDGMVRPDSERVQIW